ncbi:MAG: hypothetical protein IKK57_05565 [Clostridia bacterium]|nr:hypothetical protein [Clostridia bacterium]
MKEREQVRVMPFGMSGARLRASARDYRRRGQVLEALSLVRRAAWQDDTAASWQALAAELRQLGCWEVAGVLLGRVLSRRDAAPSAWLDMARCMLAQGSRETAEDCLYHLLHEDPWSAEADAARHMLIDLDGAEAERAHRTELLGRRAVLAWRRGEHALAHRRLRRLIRIAVSKDRPMEQLALVYLMEGELGLSVRWLSRAINEDPADVSPLTSMAAALQEAGRPRIARGLLLQAMRMDANPQEEARICSTAWLLEAWPEMAEFLSRKLRQTPHRIPLLHARANLLSETGDADGARQVWKTILSIDPDDRAAAALLEWTQENPGKTVPRLSVLPPQMLQRQRKLLPNRAEVFTWGSPARRAMDWFAASTSEEEQQLALASAAVQPDREAEIRWLRELLTRPDVQEPMRQQALLRLATLGHFDEVNILMAGRYVTAQCQPTRVAPGRRMWHMFLPQLLRTGARYGRPEELAAFAARLWPQLTPEEKQEAATTRGHGWSCMMTAMWLWQQGRREEADGEILASGVPARRFTRVFTRMLMAMENDPGSAGEGDTV